MKHILLITSLFAFVGNSKAQVPKEYGENLVPNPSFEELTGRRLTTDQDGAATFKYNILDWGSPTKTTPDLITEKDKETLLSYQENGIDIDKAHSGNKMVGIAMHSPESVRHDTYREYVQVKLKTALVVGQEYYFEVWTCRSRFSTYISNNLGFALSTTKLQQEGYRPLTDVKPIYNFDQLLNKKGRTWEKISFTFVASSPSSYLCIGNFFGNEELEMQEAVDAPKLTADEYPYKLAFFLIDDVLLCATKG